MCIVQFSYVNKMLHLIWSSYKAIVSLPKTCIKLLRLNGLFLQSLYELFEAIKYWVNGLSKEGQKSIRFHLKYYLLLCFEINESFLCLD